MTNIHVDKIEEHIEQLKFNNYCFFLVTNYGRILQNQIDIDINNFPANSGNCISGYNQYEYSEFYLTSSYYRINKSKNDFENRYIINFDAWLTTDYIAILKLVKPTNLKRSCERNMYSIR